MTIKGPLYGDHSGALYVGHRQQIPEPPRALCRSCEHEPYPIPEQRLWSCRIHMRPKDDGSCRFYRRVPGADDE